MISQVQIADIASWLQQNGSDEACLSELRRIHPDIHFTWCLDDDVGYEKAVKSEQSFNLYLVDGREHCLCFTNAYDDATGVVIAEVVEE